MNKVAFYLKPSKFKKLNWSDFITSTSTTTTSGSVDDSINVSFECVRLDVESLLTIETANRVMQNVAVLVCKITDDLVDTDNAESQNRISILEVFVYFLYIFNIKRLSFFGRCGSRTIQTYC